MKILRRIGFWVVVLAWAVFFLKFAEDINFWVDLLAWFAFPALAGLIMETGR